MPRTPKNSTWPVHLPKRRRMTAVPDSDGDRPRVVEPPRWPSVRDSGISPAGRLFGERGSHTSEVAELRRRLDEAERRAADAEEALPHLLALGQRTVNGLLSDARARGRQIIEDAREQAAKEIEAERRALAQEAFELDALRMAVAAEAMGLEQVRAELESGVAALQLHHAGTIRQLEAPDVTPESVFDPGASMLPPPPSPADLAGSGIDKPASPTPSASSSDRPSSRFADAWAVGEDEMLAEAFDRFFAAEIDKDPLRDSVLESDPEPSGD